MQCIVLNSVIFIARLLCNAVIKVSVHNNNNLQNTYPNRKYLSTENLIAISNPTLNNAKESSLG